MTAPIAGWTLIIGSVIAWAGLMTPFAGRLYGALGGADKVDERIEYVRERPGWWWQHNVFFAVGALVAAAGTLWIGGSSLAWLGAAAFVTAGVAGGAFALQRVTTDPDTWFRSEATPTTFWVYSVGTIVGSVLLAIHIGGWAGAVALGLDGILVAYLVWSRDLPPFTHYIPAVVLASALL